MVVRVNKLLHNKVAVKQMRANKPQVGFSAAAKKVDNLVFWQWYLRYQQKGKVSLQRGEITDQIEHT